MRTNFQYFEQNEVNMFIFSVKNQLDNEKYKSQIQQKIISMNDPTLIITIDSIYENMKNAAMIFNIVTLVTILITSIGLIVSGIGIMNVLLRAISERKWEIGLRKAIGADNNAILLQFLMESLLLCFIGATVGLLISIAMITFVNFIARLNVSLSGYAIIASIVFAQ